MLLQFSVENFASFREKATLSLVPTRDKKHHKNILHFENYSALSSVAISGANASGKSNLIKAISVAVQMIKNSNYLQPIDRLPYVPFKFSHATGTEPTEFEFVFIGEDGCKYVYGFSYDAIRIVNEYLYAYSSQRPSKVFERKNTSDYSFTNAHRRVLEPLTSVTSDNKLFLCSSSAWNYQPSVKVIRSLLGKINAVTDYYQLAQTALELYRDEAAKGTHDNIGFTAELFRCADISISSIAIEFQEAPPEVLQNIMMNNPTLKPMMSLQFRVTTTHIVEKEGKKEKYELDMKDESEGTQQLFFLAPVIKQIIDKGEILVFDEIEKGFHPLIVEAMIKLFSDPAKNQKRAQLVFSTHSKDFLNLKKFRRDQLYFTEKDRGTGQTYLRSLTDFSVRYDEDVAKAYLQGKYVTGPIIENELFGDSKIAEEPK